MCIRLLHHGGEVLAGRAYAVAMDHIVHRCADICHRIVDVGRCARLVIAREGGRNRLGDAAGEAQATSVGLHDAGCRRRIGRDRRGPTA
jgi:hypothetical protein